MILAQLPDQRQSVAQASREHELCIFAALNASLDELHQTQNVDVELMFLEQLLDAAQLPDREREARRRGRRRSGTRPVEIEIGRLVVARRQDVVGPRPEMAVAREEFCLRKLREILPDARPDGIDTRHECRTFFGIENAHLDEGLEQLNRYEACPRETGERQCAVSLAVLDQPVNAADLVDLRVADCRKPPFQQVDLRAVAPPQRGLAMHDAIAEAP